MTRLLSPPHSTAAAANMTDLTANMTDLTDVSFSQSVQEQIARLDSLRAEMDAFLSRLDTLKRALGETDEGGRRVRRRL